MILRRLIQHVKRQEWTAIGIEFVIVVVGVFVGIQAQQWSNEREQRRQERVYLERVLSDINLSIETNELNIARLTANSDGSTLVLNSLRGCSLPVAQRDAFADGLSDIAKVGPSVFVLSTMEEMLSAGNFSIIRNQKLRDALNGLARDAKYQHNIYTVISAQLASSTATTHTRVVWTYQDHKTPFDPVGWADMEIDFDALCKDKAYQAAVSNARYLTNAGISLNKRAIASLIGVKSALEQELGVSSAHNETKP